MCYYSTLQYIVPTKIYYDYKNKYTKHYITAI